MLKKVMKVNWEEHDARPIALLVQVASGFKSQVFIEVENKKINAKSIMGIMSLKLTDGDEVVLVAEGADEKEAVNAIEDYIGQKK